MVLNTENGIDKLPSRITNEIHTDYLDEVIDNRELLLPKVNHVNW